MSNECLTPDKFFLTCFKKVKNVKETLTEIVVILDRSGSMEHLKNDTVKAFNDFLKEQKEFLSEAPGEVFLTTVLFNNAYKLLHDRADIKLAGPMMGRQYLPRGRSALNDAFGKIIDDLGFTLNAAGEEERPRKVLLVVIANENDNASALYSKEKLAAMVDLQIKTYDWEFLFFGVGIDGNAAASIGIPADRAFGVTGDAEGVAGAFKAAGIAARNARKYRCIKR
jgi:hypothetical protein